MVCSFLLVCVVCVVIHKKKTNQMSMWSVVVVVVVVKAVWDSSNHNIYSTANTVFDDGFFIEVSLLSPQREWKRSRSLKDPKGTMRRYQKYGIMC